MMHKQPEARGRQKASALNYAVRLLAMRPYSERKLREKLLARQYESREIREALVRLKRENFLNDRRYCEDYIRIQVRARPRAATRMVSDLLARGIPLTLAKEVVAELLPKTDELALATEFVRRKLAQYARLDDATRWRRLAGPLARRGFSYHTIRQVLGKSLEQVSD